MGIVTFMLCKSLIIFKNGRVSYIREIILLISDIQTVILLHFFFQFFIHILIWTFPRLRFCLLIWGCNFDVSNKLILRRSVIQHNCIFCVYFMVGVLCYYLYCVYNKHSTLIEYPYRTPNISTGQIIRLILRSRGSLEVLYIYRNGYMYICIEVCIHICTIHICF